MHQSKVKMCFLRGPLRWLTEQKNPKFLWSLQNAQREATNLAVSKFYPERYLPEVQPFLVFISIFDRKDVLPLSCTFCLY